MNSREHHNHNTSEAWRMECEARYVISMTDIDRRTYLAGVKDFRGPAARLKLESEIKRLVNNKKGASGE